MTIDKEKCVGCGGCINLCPEQAISFAFDRACIDAGRCTGCCLCAQVCGVEAPQSDT